MPKKKKSSGFSHQKSGKRGGRGFKGRKKWSVDDQGEEVSNDEGQSELFEHDSDSQESTTSVITGTQDVTASGLFTSVSGPGNNIPPATIPSPTFPAEEPNNSSNTLESVEATTCNEPGPHNNMSPSILPSSTCLFTKPSNYALQSLEATIVCNVTILGPLITATDSHGIDIPPLTPNSTNLPTEPNIKVFQGADADVTTANVTCTNSENSSAMATKVLNLLNALLPMHWKCILGRKGFHVVLMSRSTKNIAIQREVFASFYGDIEEFDHRKKRSEALYKDCLKDVKKLVLMSESAKEFCDNILKVVLAVRQLEICAGSDHEVMFEDIRAGDASGVIDNNPYDESRYERTFRSNDCILLVPVHTWRCHGCAKSSKRFRERIKHHQDEEVKKHTKNEYLDPKQARFKMKSLQKELRSVRKKVDYLSTKVSQALNQEGVYIEKEYSEDLTNILRDWGNLTPIQQMFIQQQVKSASCKGASGMRWHPTMIRLSLSIQSTSNAAYTALRDSGMIRLPCQRTLFDYSHAVPRSEGIFTEKLQVVGEKVQKFEEEHKKYFSLLFDEIHISQKLVYRKSDGALVGYVKLEEVDMEMQNLLNAMNNQNVRFQPVVATKILAYMIKGYTNTVKEVVAAFPTATITKEQLFSRTWDVIQACEGQGIKILAMICDGSSINRAFIAMHTPATTSHGVVFDTVHLCAPDRKIFFIADPPHLLKTIRNCFAKSGTSKRCTRLMKMGNEFIQWKTIERLYLEDVNDPVRRSCKLNSQNVFLNSYTCMKVSYAAQVMSRTVAMDLESRKWPGTGATVHFNSKVNDFFDCLNGSHMDIARKKANDRLKPYTSINDIRFNENFEKYIRDWEKDVRNLRGVPKSKKMKMTLSPQTMEGISITVHGFIGAAQFLLSVGAKYLHGRAFCQDPLEQYFSKQRASLGGRNNPTVDSFLSSDVKISTQRFQCKEEVWERKKHT